MRGSAQGAESGGVRMGGNFEKFIDDSLFGFFCALILI